MEKQFGYQAESSQKITSKSVLALSICQILLGVAKKGFDIDATRFETLIDALLPTLPESNSWVIANTIWSLGEMKYKLPKQTFRMILDAFVEKISEASPIAVSQVLLGAAKKKYQVNRDTLETLVTHLLDISDRNSDPRGQVMANTIWALGEMDDTLQTSTTQGILDLFMKKLEEAKPINISQVLLGLAKKKFYSDERTIKLLVETLLSHRTEVNPQAIANSIWALGENGATLSNDVFDCVLRMFLEKLPQAEPDDISQVLVGVTKKGFDIERDVLEKLIAHLLQSYQPDRDRKAAGVSLWAVSKLKKGLPVEMIMSLKNKARINFSM